MSYKNTDLKSTHHAMKVIRDGMRKARVCHEKRKQENDLFTAEINRKYPSDKYSKSFYDSQILPKLRAEIKEHNEKVNNDFMQEMGQTSLDMIEAVRTLKANKDFKNQALDFSDPTLINALRMLDTYGKDMPYEEQLNLCYSFRGDLPALRAIESGMKKNSMRYSRIAHELQSGFDSEMLDEMEQAFITLANGRYTLGGYNDWFVGEIEKKAEYYGLDLEKDPYREAIASVMDKTTNAYLDRQEKQRNTRNLVEKWEADLREMEKNGETERANRSAKQIYDAVKEDGLGIIFD